MRCHKNGEVGPGDGLDFGEEAMDEMEIELGVPESVAREEMLGSHLGKALMERHLRSFLVEIHLGNLQPTVMDDVLGDHLLPDPDPVERMADAAPGIVRLSWDGDLQHYAAWEHLEILGWMAPFGFSVSERDLGTPHFSVFLLVRLKEDADIPSGGMDELMADVLQALQIQWQVGRQLMTMTYWQDYGWEFCTARGLPERMERVDGLECFY